MTAWVSIGQPRRPQAYDPAGLHVLSYARGFTLWHYRSASPLEAVARPGFFNEARHLLRPGDRIAVNVHDGERFLAACDFCVLAVDRGDVRLAPVSAAAAA